MLHKTCTSPAGVALDVSVSISYFNLLPYLLLDLLHPLPCPPFSSRRRCAIEQDADKVAAAVVPREIVSSREGQNQILDETGQRALVRHGERMKPKKKKCERAEVTASRIDRSTDGCRQPDNKERADTDGEKNKE